MGTKSNFEIIDVEFEKKQYLRTFHEFLSKVLSSFHPLFDMDERNLAIREHYKNIFTQWREYLDKNLPPELKDKRDYILKSMIVSMKNYDPLFTNRLFTELLTSGEIVNKSFGAKEKSKLKSFRKLNRLLETNNEILLKHLEEILKESGSIGIEREIEIETIEEIEKNGFGRFPEWSEFVDVKKLREFLPKFYKLRLKEYFPSDLFYQFLHYEFWGDIDEEKRMLKTPNGKRNPDMRFKRKLLDKTKVQKRLDDYTRKGIFAKLINYFYACVLMLNLEYLDWAIKQQENKSSKKDEGLNNTSQNGTQQEGRDISPLRNIERVEGLVQVIEYANETNKALQVEKEQSSNEAGEKVFPIPILNIIPAKSVDFDEFVENFKNFLAENNCLSGIIVYEKTTPDGSSNFLDLLHFSVPYPKEGFKDVSLMYESLESKGYPIFRINNPSDVESFLVLTGLNQQLNIDPEKVSIVEFTYSLTLARYRLKVVIKRLEGMFLKT